MKNSVSDLFLMASYGIKAPSGHNTQPWKIRIDNNTFEVHPDFSFSLPVADQNNRELYVSVGCAIENICLAANEKGFGEQVIIRKHPDDYTFACIEITKGTANPSSLFSQIAKRQTNRSVYFDRVIPQKDIIRLSNIKLEDGIKSHIYRYDEKEFSILSDFILQANEVQLSNPLYKEELLDWIRFTKKQVNNHKCGLSYKTIGASGIPSFLRKAVIKSQLKVSKQNKADKKRISSSSHLVLFTCENNTAEEWIKLGRSLERFLLKACKIKIACGFLNQPCEVEALAETVKDKLEIEGMYPVILVRMGYARSMAFSPRKQAESIIDII